MLQNLNKWINSVVDFSSPLLTFQSVIKDPLGLDHFRRWLNRDEEGGTPTVKSDSPRPTWTSISPRRSLLTCSLRPCRLPLRTYLSRHSRSMIASSRRATRRSFSESTDERRSMVEDQLYAPSNETFDALRATSMGILHMEFADWKRTPDSKRCRSCSTRVWRRIGGTSRTGNVSRAGRLAWMNGQLSCARYCSFVLTCDVAFSIFFCFFLFPQRSSCRCS